MAQVSRVLANGAVTSAKLATGLLSVQRASSLTTVDGAVSGDVIYTNATVTCTAGTWLIIAGVTLLNLTTADDASAGVYNRTTGAAVTNSRSVSGTTSTTFRSTFITQATTVTITSSTDFCPQAFRSSASSLRLAGGAVAPAGWITALCISIP